MTYTTEEQPKNYTSDRPGLQEAARDLVKREAEPEEPGVEPAPVWSEVPDQTRLPAEEKGPVSLSEWRKEHEAEKEAFAKFRNEQEQPPEDALALPALSEEAAEQPDPEELAIRQLIESGAATKEDIDRGYELLRQRDERKLHEKQTEFAQNYLDIHSRMQAASSSFGMLQHRMQQEFQRRFGVDPRNHAEVGQLLQNPQLQPHIAEFVNEANRMLEPHAITLQQEQAKHAQAHEVFNQVQDGEFERRVAKEHPDLNGEAREKVARHVLEMLRAEGLADEEIAALWSGSATVPFRHAGMQAVLLKAARYDLARKKASTAQRMPLPPVLRPGVAGPQRNLHSEEIAALKRKPALTLREAARLNLLRQETRSQ